MIDGSPASDNNQIEVSHADDVEVTYLDTDTDAGYAQLRSAVATIDDHGDDAESATILELPATIAGSIGSSNDADWFAFTAEAGVRYEWEVQLGTLDASFLQVYDRDLRDVASDDDGGDGLGSKLSFLATTSDLYYIAVAGYDARSVGTYNLFAAMLEDDHGGFVGRGTMVRRSGNLRVAEFRFYPVTASRDAVGKPCCW